MGPQKNDDWYRRRASLLADLARHHLKRARRVRARDLVMELTRTSRPTA